MIDFIMRCRRTAYPAFQGAANASAARAWVPFCIIETCSTILSLKAQDQQGSLYNKKLLTRPGKYSTTRKQEGYRSMNHVTHNTIVNFIWGIATGKYREEILDSAGDYADMEDGE